MSKSDNLYQPSAVLSSPQYLYHSHVFQSIVRMDAELQQAVFISHFMDEIQPAARAPHYIRQPSQFLKSHVLLPSFRDKPSDSSDYQAFSSQCLPFVYIVQLRKQLPNRCREASPSSAISVIVRSLAGDCQPGPGSLLLSIHEPACLIASRNRERRGSH